jgi:amino acid adenylation domain-containing protein
MPNDYRQLSFAQRRLWYLQQLHPDDASYNIRLAYRVSGPLDVSALSRALADLIARHEILRTRFTAVEGRPLAVLGDAPQACLRVLDCSDRPERDWEAAARAILLEAANQPFDLAADLPVRAVLVEHGRDEHVLGLIVHHIVFDGASAAVLARELSHLYDHHVGFRSAPNAPASQYAAYTDEQLARAGDEAARSGLEHWKRNLEGLAAVSLPRIRLDPDRSPATGFGNAAVELPEDVCQGLRGLARESRVTLFVVLLAAFAALLHRYTGATDIGIGAPVADRSEARTQGLIGLFLNTVVFRIDVSGRPSFTELVRRARSTWLQAVRHSATPFERIVEELPGDRLAGQMPLIGAWLSVQPGHRQGLTLTGLASEAFSLEVPTPTRVDVSLAIVDSGGPLLAIIRHLLEVMDLAAGRRMAEHFVNLTSAMLATPGTAVEALPLMGEAERMRTVHETNDTDRALPSPYGVHERFSARTALAPEAIALVVGGRRLSRGQLDRSSDRLASRLRRHGVGPEVLVGLYFERSVELVVAILAVWKAGGAYLPLDLTAPPERLLMMLREARIGLVLTHAEARARLPESGARVVLVEPDPTPAWGQTGTAASPPGDVHPDQLAYVIATSGSSGIPKGVMVTHGALANYVQAVIDVLQPPEQASFALVSTHAADLGHTMTFTSLGSGGVLHIMLADESTDPERFATRLARQGLDYLKITPSHWAALRGSAGAAAVGPRRALLFGGEALSARLAAGLPTELTPCRVLNHYGPTETTVGCLTYELPAEAGEAAGATVPIGQPLANVRRYVVDELMNPVVSGTAGELYIGGGCLARGYLDRPALTAEAFVPDPFGTAPGGRLYRTGDIVRALAGGQLEFLRRRDAQVKIRGYRVEPAEVETILRRHPEVHEGRVVALAGDDGQVRLAGFVVMRDTAGPDAVLPYLRARLPDHMIPSTLVRLERMPLTANGKVDRARLRQLGAQPTPAVEASAETPDLTRLERSIAEIWSDVLGTAIERRTDNFIARGGHSLLAIRAVARIRSELAVNVSLRNLLDAPTLGAFARVVQHSPRQTEEV